jgi:AcrR family transcriptional regulator
MSESGKDSVTRQKILEASINLFLKQGYEKTTLLQITARANVTTGSLYHFFSNKEEIVVTVLREIFESLISRSNRIALENNDPALGFSIEIALHFKILEKYPAMVDIWHIIYGSEKGSAIIMNLASNAAVNWFGKYNPGYTKDDYYLQAIAMRGISLSFMSEERYGRSIDPVKRLSFITRSALIIFNVPEDEIERILDKTGQIVSDIDFTLEEYVRF